MLLLGSVLPRRADTTAVIGTALLASTRGAGYRRIAVAERTRYTDRAFAEAAAGTIAPVIGQTFPLERAADAHAAIEGRQVFGTTLLTM